jgi:hypothetical protein
MATPQETVYIGAMLWRVRNSRGRPLNAPAAFIHPCQPIVAKQPPTGPGWAHELKQSPENQIYKFFRALDVLNT